MRCVFIAALAVFFASHSAAEETSICNGRVYKSAVKVPCSHTWTLTGPCNGRDLVYDWKVDGNRDGDSFMRPFADTPVIITGYEVVKRFGGPTTYLMIGSGHQPDAFLWIGPGENRARVDFPPGYGHPWPSKQEAAANWKPGHEEMIDLHGGCTSPKVPFWNLYERFIRPPRPVTGVVYVTVYYIAQP